jgi:hypothetical protein
MKENIVKPIEKINHNLGTKQSWIRGKYYADHSGEILITYKGRHLFHADERRAECHLKWLRMAVETAKSELATLKKAEEIMEQLVYELPKAIKQ